MTAAVHVSRIPGAIAVGDVLTLASDVADGAPSAALARDLLIDGFSAHGARYLAPIERCAIPPFDLAAVVQFSRDVQSHVCDYTFELIRRLDFPDSPSRFASVFGLEDVSHLVAWPDLMTPGAELFEIEYTGHSVRLDAAWLRSGMVTEFGPEGGVCQHFTPEVNWASAHEYWRGTPSASPKWELLIEGPVRVTRRLGRVEFGSEPGVPGTIVFDDEAASEEESA